MNSLPLNPEKIYDGTECILVLPGIITRVELANCRSWHDEKDATMFGRGSVKITDVINMTKWLNGNVVEVYGPNAAIIREAVAVFLRNSTPLAEGRGGSPLEVVVR